MPSITVKENSRRSSQSSRTLYDRDIAVKASTEYDEINQIEK